MIPSLFAAAAAVVSAADITWYDALSLGIAGSAYPSNAASRSANMSYARLPPGAQADVNPGEWSWSLTSSGLFVQFLSNASEISLNYTLRSAELTDWPNFSVIGFSGADLYAFDEGSHVLPVPCLAIEI